ncbi:DUF4920 domain-containing protein [Niabella ginsengisoli]|uniref:DUF4920 domain-containing protein n=1 Tax=Niabella ginsengisoli TaxID=522298 RepID=A0ABS9SQ05_9BACT|nr:DUF4920 domain-containing protein [Niabella ginsengisoli]MCH5600468.1 DUF4920 domain-containing protein [Niabella ginsengisoli]
MKKIFFALLIITVATFTHAQPPVGPATPGNIYGEKTTAEDVVPLTDVTKSLSKIDTIQTKITGKVLASCPKMGCWMDVELADKSKMFVKFKDYAFFVPTDIVGKTVVLDGLAFTKTTSVAELQHYAKDAKKSKEEIEAIKKPQKQLRFLADGVLVVK